MKPNIQRLLSMLTALVVDAFHDLGGGWRGAVPLQFIIIGSIWFFRIQARIKAQ